jgi:DNA polymerase III subunit delta
MCPAVDAKALRAAIKDHAFAPAYYFYGEDDYLKNDELQRLVAAAVEPATRDFNYEVLRGAEIDAEALGTIVGTPPMMADRRVVVIRDVNALKKDARAALDAYLKRPAPDLLLVLIAASGAKADKGLLATASALEFTPLSGSRIPRWITYYVEHDLGTTITDGAVTLLQEAVGTDLLQLKTELDKAGAFTGGGPITEAAVSAVVGVRPGETMGDFLDAVAQRDPNRALAMLSTVLEQPKSSAVTMIMALTSQMLVIGWAQAARERGTSAARLSGELFTLLKESGSVFTGRAWGEFVTTCARAADTWTAAAIDAALEALLDADAALKGTRLSSDEQVISTLVFRLCAVPTHARAA